MIFALGARLAQPLPGLASPESYYTKAMEHLETIVGLHDLKNVQVAPPSGLRGWRSPADAVSIVQALLLMVVYSFRAPTAPSTWFLIGIIVSLAFV